MSEVMNQAKRARTTAMKLGVASTESKNDVLKKIAQALDQNRESIIRENIKDMELAKKNSLNSSLLKRLKVDNSKIDEMIAGVKSVVALDDPVNNTLEAIEMDKGLDLYKISCPIGVIGVIFESRPDALVQISALCIKSGNAVILKGGSEAKHSNRVLGSIISKIADTLALGSVQLIETREEVSEVLKLDKYIDLIIPRGSNSFVRYIQEHSRIPVLGHSDGLCHVFVDKDADIKKAVKICFDSKCQYAAVCNAMETLLVHKNVTEQFLPFITEELLGAGVELRGDEKTREIVKMKKASEVDWKTEYNDLILSVKVVDSVEEAITHINKFGSKHTDAIVTENETTARKFLNLVDASSVMWNSSTRFADGFRYGKGAEVGISTARIHSRGPVGLEGLVIYKYLVKGDGHIVEDYTGKNAKQYTHKRSKKKW